MSEMRTIKYVNRERRKGRSFEEIAKSLDMIRSTKNWIKRRSHHLRQIEYGRFRLNRIWSFG